MFINLHVHSEYSLLDGMCNLSKLVTHAASMGQTSVAVTDHGTLHAPVKFFKECKELEEKKGIKIKPIYGIEVYVVPDMKNHLYVRECVEQNKKIKKGLKAKEKKEFNAPVKIVDYFNYLANENEQYFGNSSQNESEDLEAVETTNYRYSSSHLVLLAKNNEGFYNLMQIATESQLEGFYNKPRVDANTLSRLGKGIIALSACRAGEIPRLILRHREDLAILLIEKYKSIFDEFYLELQPPVVPEQAYINSVLLELSKVTNTPLVVTCDAHYLRKEDAAAHENLMKMQTNGKFWFKEQCYFLHSEDEIRSYDGIPEEAITNTGLIADKCNVILDTSQKIPLVTVPEGYDSNSYISHLANQGLADYLSKKNIDASLYPEYYARLNFELDVITSKGLSDYLLIIADIINHSRSEGILIGPGRGSSGGSMVCMCLGITQIDPIQYDLLFERFTSIDRPTTPDIDSDISEYIMYPPEFEYIAPSGRQKTIDYMVKKYGQDSICQIVAFGTMGTRLILKDAARILNMDHNEVNDINKLVPSEAGFQWTIKECLEGDDRTFKSPVPEIVAYAEEHPLLFSTALELEGNPRHTSIHAAGVVLAPGRVRNYIPLMLGDEDEVVSQWDMKDLEYIGVLKIDLLGLRTIGTFQRANEFIKARHNVDVDINEIPREDERVLHDLKSGRTKGVFQVESDGMTSIFKRLNKVTFNDIVAIISIFRPGPIKFVDQFIKRANGQEEVSYLFPELEPILNNTYGIMTYQEQVMKIATDCAGFSKADSDAYRKVIGKKQKDKIPTYNDWLVNGNKEKKIPGLVANGINREVAEQLAEDLVAFASYSFNKSHAVAYAIQTITTGWYKTYYPVEYMTALLSSHINKNREKIITYLQESKDIGLGLLPPSVNASEYEFSIENNKIRFGFGAIKGLGFVSINIALERHRNGIFSSLNDFIERTRWCGLNKKTYDAMIFSGCLDCFSNKENVVAQREDILERVYTAFPYGDKEDAIIKMFDQGESTTKNVVSKDTKRVITFLSIEKDIVGWQFSPHLLEGKASPVDWEQPFFDVVAIVRELHHKVTKTGKPYLLLVLDTLEGDKTVFIFDNCEELFPKLKVNGIRLFTIRSSVTQRGRTYIAKNCKYYRENEQQQPLIS